MNRGFVVQVCEKVMQEPKELWCKVFLVQMGEEQSRILSFLCWWLLLVPTDSPGFTPGDEVNVLTHFYLFTGVPGFLSLTMIFPFQGGSQFTAFSVFLICLPCGEKNG